MKINLPDVVRVHRAFSVEGPEESYTNLFRKVFDTVANSLLRRYQLRPLQNQIFYVAFLEYQTMPRYKIEAVSEFYDNWNSSEFCVNVSCYSLGYEGWIVPSLLPKSAKK